MSSIFREKSLERVKSPEQLEEYIHVSNPSVWMILGAIVALLAGLLIWGAVGTIEEKVPGALVVRGGAATCYVDQTRSADVAPGDRLRVEGDKAESGMVTGVAEQPVSTSMLAQAVGTALGQDTFGTSAWAAELAVSSDLPEGIYAVDVITAVYHPIALLLGNA